MFATQTIRCPACGTDVAADLFFSINADRRPDLRAAAIDGSLQRQTCRSCQADFRVDPEFNYLDIGRGQWIAVHPFGQLRDWEALERSDEESFDRAYGPAASAGARAIGAGLTVRIVFGWAALREKLVAAEAGLDDRELELLKMAILRTRDDAPLSDTVELRFVESVPEGLVLAWIDLPSDRGVETLLVPRRAYEAIATDPDGWAGLRAALGQGRYVDMQRLIV